MLRMDLDEFSDDAVEEFLFDVDRPSYKMNDNHIR